MHRVGQIGDSGHTVECTDALIVAELVPVHFKTSRIAWREMQVMIR